MKKSARVLTPDGPGSMFGPQYDRWLSGAVVVGWWVDVDGAGRKCFRLDEIAPLPREVAHA